MSFKRIVKENFFSFSCLNPACVHYIFRDTTYALSLLENSQVLKKSEKSSGLLHEVSKT